MSEWIDVEDRLPEKQGYYLVYSWVNRYHVSQFSTMNVYSDGKTPCFPQNATHWMPLPEPPK
jgi:hypothetical protein